MVDYAVLDVWLAHVWQRQAGHLDIRSARLLYRFSDPRDGWGGDSHYKFHLGIHLKNVLGFGKCFVPVAVARLNSDYLHFRILFGKPLPDKLYPFVLVSRTQAGRH